MTQFVDSTGAAWSLSVTLGSARRVLEQTGADLLDPSSKSGDLAVSQRLLYDDLFLADVVAALIAPQLKERNLGKDAFLDRVDGATLQRIEKIFWEEYSNFFAQRGKDWAAKAVLLDLETKNKAARTALEKIDGASSNDSPDGAESTPID